MHLSPARAVREKRILINNLRKDTLSDWKRYLAARLEQLRKNSALLDTLSPLGVLQRGYSITRKPGGEIVRSAGVLAKNEEVSIQLAKGGFCARVEKTYDE